MSIPALSVKQPWASLIIYGIGDVWKDIENRSWPLPKTFKTPQRVLIHSSKGHHIAEWHAAQRLCERIGLQLPAADRLAQAYPAGWAPRGVIIGDVEIWGQVAASTNRWFCGRFGLQLHDRRAWKFPVPAKGALGFWKYEGPLPSGF